MLKWAYLPNISFDMNVWTQLIEKEGKFDVECN
jgi:hypothetical protein